MTSRTSEVALPLPVEADAYSFVIFGDRTGGIPTGVSILADAVRDVNLLEPDMVMTVGDLIQGYNDAPLWLEQMREYKAIMNRLLCPWFPVAGNHDVIWRGEGEQPQGEHDGRFEKHFGPLWYAFEHKKSWFIVLYSDESNPSLPRKDISDPKHHEMSPEQFAWLGETLKKAKGAEHVFLFLHHPRWTGGPAYGDSWDRVHALLAKAGNVTAVFAGHIHQMRYDGPKDGIEYVTLATTGGHNSARIPEIGFLHQYHVINVRKAQVAMASYPVGAAMDVREITQDVRVAAMKVQDTPPTFAAPLKISGDASVRGSMRVTLNNPTTRPVEYTLVPDSRDSRWTFEPDHIHTELAAGATQEVEVKTSRGASTLDSTFRPAELVVDAEMLMPSHRYVIPTQRMLVPSDIDSLRTPAGAPEQALSLDGDRDAVLIPAAQVKLDAAALTVETWFKAESFAKRTGLISKAESSGWGMFVSDGRPQFSVHVDGAYLAVRGAPRSLAPGRWHHMAGVYDGTQVRLYLDGALVDSKNRTPAVADAPGTINDNARPMVIGGDVNRDNLAVDRFNGAIDGVRLSRTARYEGPTFTPQRRPASDDATLLLLNMDARVGPWLFDDSPRRHNPVVTGDPQIAATTVP